MIDLGKYATEVLLAYAVSISMIVALVGITLAQARRAKRILKEAEDA